MTISIVEEMWLTLDKEYIRLMNLEDSSQRDMQKWRLRGMAEMVVLWMGPYFPESDDVVREVVQRADKPNRQTAGLRERIFSEPWTLEVGQQVECITTGHAGQIKTIQYGKATVEFRKKSTGGGYGVYEESELRAIAPNGAIWVDVDSTGKKTETPGPVRRKAKALSVDAVTQSAVLELKGKATAADIAEIYGLTEQVVEQILAKS